MTVLATTAKSLVKLLPPDKEPLLRLMIGMGENSWTLKQSLMVWGRLKANEFTLQCVGQKLPKQPTAPLILPIQETFVDFQENKFILKLSEEHEEFLDQFQIHKMRQDKKSLLWTVPFRMDPVLTLHRYLKELTDIHVTPAAKAAVAEMYREMRERYHASKAQDADIDLTGFGLLDAEHCKTIGVNPGLYPYQRAGIKAAVRCKRCWIADDMGLGKTRQALGVLFVTQAFPALIVCPSSVVINWIKEASAAFPGRKFYYAKSKSEPVHSCKLKSQQMSLFCDAQQLIYDASCDACQLDAADIIVINYHKIPDGWKEGRDKDGKKIKGFKRQKGERCQVQLSGVAQRIATRRVTFFAGDESHYLKNNATQWTKGVKELVSGVGIRLLLSGTPIKNRPAELEPQAEILDRLDDLGGYHLFHKNYCNMQTSGKKAFNTDGSSNETHLNKMLRAVGFIQRNKRDVLTDLPLLTESLIEVELDNEEEYLFAKKKTIEWCAEQAVKKKEFLEMIANLNPSDQSTLIERKKLETRLRTMRAEAMIRIMALRKVAALGKLSAMRDWIEDFKESDNKLVIFAHHKEVQQAIQTKFNTLHIFGSDPMPDRQEAVRLFQDDPSHKFITISSAAREGVTLTAASILLMLERQWTPADESQVIGRIERIGAKFPMFVYRAIGRLPNGEETIDHMMDRLLAKKKTLCDAVVKGEITEEEADEFDVVSEIMEAFSE